MSRLRPRLKMALLLVLTPASLIAGCANGSGTAATGSASAMTSSVPSAGAQSASEVTVSNQWVRATENIADPSMSTVFAEFKNNTGKQLTIVSATNSLTKHSELHVMTMTGGVMVMTPTKTGIKIPAGGTASLDPNSAHIMIMDLKTKIQPGDLVTVTAKLDDGTSFTFDALGKDYAGGDESYPSGSSGMTPMSKMGKMGMTGMPAATATSK